MTALEIITRESFQHLTEHARFSHHGGDGSPCYSWLLEASYSRRRLIGWFGRRALLQPISRLPVELPSVTNSASEALIICAFGNTHQSSIDGTVQSYDYGTDGPLLCPLVSLKLASQ